MATENVMVNDRREIFGWAMYDWANSAFSTTIGTVFLAPFVASLARTAAEAAGTATASFFGIPVAPDSFLPYCISFSVGMQVLFLPILGAIADYSHLRKRMMQIFATIGAVATILMFFVTGGLWWLGGVLFIVANLAFGAAMVFYNSYLPDIASEDERDRVSSYGWAMGYMGGGILLALNLAFFTFSENLGVPENLAIRINLASAGIWWLGFSFLTWSRLRSRRAARQLPASETYVSIGFKQLRKTISEVKHFPETLKFLIAYFLYNDGIQTVIAVASTFAAAPLIQGGLELEQQTLIAVILMIQFVAFFGALFWGRLAGWIGAKQSVIVSLGDLVRRGDLCLRRIKRSDRNRAVLHPRNFHCTGDGRFASHQPKSVRTDDPQRQGSGILLVLRDQRTRHFMDRSAGVWSRKSDVRKFALLPFFR